MHYRSFGPLLLSAACLASAPGAASETTIETITVTAHRLPSSSGVLPTLTRAVDDAPQVGTDALRDLPSFAISQSGSLGSVTQVRVRGAEASHLLVLVDGVAVMDPATDSGFNFANFNLAGIDRLEYLPGAQSAIWGSDAVAGVLHLSTRPTRDQRRLAVEGGSFESRAVSLRAAEAKDSHYYNVSFSDFTTDGTNISRTGSGKDGFDSTSAVLSGGVSQDRWALRGLVRGIRTESDFDPVSFVTGLPEDGDRQNRHNEALALVGLDLYGVERPWQERLTVSWFDTANRTISDRERTAAVDGRRVVVSSVTRLPLAPNQHVELLLEHQRERFEQTGEATLWGDPNQTQRVRTNSAGLEYFIAPIDGLRLSVSARHDDNSEFRDSQSYRLGTSYALGDAALIWLGAGTGIKHPSFIERYGFTPDQFIGNKALDSEENRHLSLGITTEAGDWTLSGTLYRDRLEDEINGFFFDVGAGGFTSVNRDGTSKRQGAEISAARSFRATALQVGASYLDAEEPDGQREVRRPRWQGFVRVDHTLPWAEIGADAFYVGEQIDLDFSDWPAARADLDAYTLVNARIRVPIGTRADLTLRATNLLDERYEDVLGYRAPGRAYYLQMGFDL
jgi:vitamin B12 transporter